MAPVFYGAISIYLKQLYPIFRSAPKWVDKLLNSKPLLKMASGMAGSTRAKGLEEMTVSMLMGEHGQQKEELEKMVDWLESHFKPDVIHISNALLLGLAHRLKERLNVPIVCSLQDEHVWVDVMRGNFPQEVWRLMQEKAKDIDRFISVSSYYTSFMKDKDKLHLNDENISTLHLGVNPKNYNYINSIEKPRNIGFISRLCYANGLDILVDAFIEIKKDNKNDDVKLLLTGGFTNDDKKFLNEQKGKLRNAGLSDDFEIIIDFNDEKRNEFFSRVSVLSVPVRGGEAFGIYLLEAMASGVPIVQPALGAFPEIVEKSSGGAIFPNNTSQELSASLNSILNNKNKLSTLSKNAREGVEKSFNINILSKDLVAIYDALLVGQSAQKTQIDDGDRSTKYKQILSE